MAGRHRKHAGQRRRVRKEYRFLVSSLLAAGLAATGFFVAQELTAGGGAEPEAVTAPSTQARTLTAPRATLDDPPSGSTTPTPRRTTARPATRPTAEPATRPTAEPSPTRTERPARGRTREAVRRCPVEDDARDHPNGAVPESHLCALPQQGHRLHGAAVDAFWRLDAAYRRAFGEPLCVSSSYRSLEEQQELYRAKPDLAAKPGTSNHGWGLAVDLCDGPDKFGTPQYAWLTAHGPDYGWENPSWARQGGSRPEPWHWEYVGDKGS